MDAIVKSGNTDGAVRLVQRRKDIGENMDGIARGAAEQTGMQVAVGAGQPDLLIDQSAQRGRDRRRLGVPHAGVADQCQIALEFRGIVAHEAEEVL